MPREPMSCVRVIYADAQLAFSLSKRVRYAIDDATPDAIDAAMPDILPAATPPLRHY